MSEDKPMVKPEKAPVAPRKKMGRPRGSKSKSTILKELLDSPLLSLAKDPSKDLADIYDVLVRKAKAGESWAQNIYWNKVIANAGSDGAVAKKGSVTVNISISDMEKGVTIEGKAEDA